MSFCKKCGNKLKEGVEYCTKCGAKVKKEQPKKEEEKSNFCKKCGHKISIHEKFCSECGVKIGGGEPKHVKKAVKKSKKGLVIAIAVIAVIIVGAVIFNNVTKTGRPSVTYGSEGGEQKPSFTEKIVKKAYCGNNACESGEDSSNCCVDCACPSGYSCDGTGCKKLAKCGNGIQEEGETSENCCMDAGCSTGYACEQNRCVELKPELSANFQQSTTKSITYFKAKERVIGTLTVSNTGNSIAKNTKVRVSSPNGYFNNEIISFGNINDGSQQSKGVSLIFTNKALDISNKAEIKMNIKMDFEDKDNRGHSTSRTATFTVMGRNYMRWSEPREIASWITPNHPTIKEFASKATAGLAASSDVGTTKNQELAARWLLESMRAYGIRYVNDPFNKEGDFVQFPTETLLNKAGDCEDNAILYASLLAAVGMEPVIILTPSHAFAGYINKDGKIVPIETTSLDYDTALASGLNNVNRNKDKMQIIKLEWNNNPQVILPLKQNLKLPSITKNIGECGTSFNFQDLFVASVPITFTNSGQVPGAGCASVTIYEEGGVLRDEEIGCWVIQPGETKSVTFQPDISVFSGYYCDAK
ncbi:hypothetical protein CMO93_01335 [Candidatus Woesearchaeota archaeon]|nr:hypothetical protein [Candidatus Woesearchaeota archaeon]|tara:strand:- start:1736 stop:3493 length:1758 start_codon:yes stop_codon:yes gene_type:complete